MKYLLSLLLGLTAIIAQAGTLNKDVLYVTQVPVPEQVFEMTHGPKVPQLLPAQSSISAQSVFPSPSLSTPSAQSVS